MFRGTALLLSWLMAVLTPAPQRTVDSISMIVPNPRRWQAAAQPRRPQGYVCMFYSSAPDPSCKAGDVRPLGSWQPRKPDRCGSSLAVYRAPSRDPHRPARDKSGIVHIPSDGRWFMFIELDDHVVEAETCRARRREVGRELQAWAARLRQAEQREAIPG